ncbi:hypothetical protein DFQ27_008869 [Actinomortierella ambigua]|uniref:hydroxyacylglutathione hydrolase n=1 Tax=Actinomortierella ambigua TaxID=1343610 RepID=A0A9P6UA72_9FUNG|nr:hypothetical protein DFQ27_008869 [Actinomortierella ambigua]
MRIYHIPALEDNYTYLILDEATKRAAVVDPVDPATILGKAHELGATITSILCTHHHWDHTDGNLGLLEQLPGIPIYGADDRVPGQTHFLKDREVFHLGAISIETLYTKCHTQGSVCFYVTEGQDRAVFTGDTLFLAGCGRFFEGTAAEMHHSLQGVLAKLPADTKVYPGHEYTQANLRFSQHVEPNNSHIAQRLVWASQNRVTIPGTLSEEYHTNPFWRVNEHDVQQFAASSDPVEVMRILREKKNAFR